MNRLKFWLEKFKFMIAFAWWREWGLVRDEWKLTHTELKEARENSDKILKEAFERIMKETEEN